MIKAAVIHRSDREYCYKAENGGFIIRLHTAHGDMAEVSLNYRDKYMSNFLKDIDKTIPMTLVASNDICDYYECHVDFEGICLRYYFILRDHDGNVCYHGNNAFFDEPIDDIYYMFDMPRILREEDAFIAPKWAAGGVVYQIFPERFSPDIEPSENDSKWYQSPMPHNQRLGGTLKGITAHLPHLAELGIDALYMTPIFLSPSDHKYNTRDYLQIDPDFGCEADLIELTSTAHSMGIRVILDGVFNHCDPKFFAFADIMENQEKSKYVDWFYIKSFPVEWKMPKHFKRSEMKIPNYETFSYFGGMPKLNCANPEVREYISRVVEHWMTVGGIDGWRLDVADEIGHDFWRFFRKEVKRHNPEAIISGEIWAHTSTFLQGDEWDTFMNYRFYNAVRDCVAIGKYPVSHLANELSAIRGDANRQSYSMLWNLIGSHDTPRILHLAGEDVRRFKLASAIQLTTAGMPMIYYGDEYGMTGGMDPDCRRGMVWDEKRQNKDIYSHYRKLILLRKSSDALKHGETAFIVADDSSNLLAYERFSENERVCVILNVSDKAVDVHGTAAENAIGKTELVNDSIFDGRLDAFEFAVVKIK